MKSRFKNTADIQKYLLEYTGFKILIEKRRSQLYFYYSNNNEVEWWSIYADIKSLTEKNLVPLVKLLTGNTVPYYE